MKRIYRLWSEHLSWSYFDHPPLIAWILAAVRQFFELFGPKTIVGTVQDLALVRLPAAFLTVAFGLSMANWLHRRGFNRKSAIGGTFAVLTVPLFAAGGALFTPDSLVIPCYWLAFTAWERALSSSKRKHALHFGIWLGLGLLSKYSMILILLPVLLSLRESSSRKKDASSLISLLRFRL